MSATENVSYAGERLLKISEVCQRTSICKSKIYKMVAENTFPAPITITPKMSRWLETELNAWFEKLKAEAA